MAEYYAVLKKAVGGLEPGAAESRRAVYDKARNALIGQLKAIDPPLPPAEISRQRLELEEAIRRVERETTAEAQNMRTQRQESLPAAAPEPPPQPSPPLPRQPAAKSDQPTPQDVFRRAIRQAETRNGGTPPAAAERAAPPVERAPVPDRASDQGATAQYYASYGPNVRSSGDWSPINRQDRPSEAQQPPPGPAAGDRRLAPDYDAEPDWQARQAPPPPSPENEPYAERRDRPYPQETRRRTYREPDDDESLEPRRRSRLPTILLLVLILAMIGGLGALAWSQRDTLGDIVASLDGSGNESEPAQNAAPPADAAKQPDRVAEDEAPSDSSVRVVGEPQAAPEPESQTAASDPIANAISNTPEEQQSAATAEGGQKAVLYEEPVDAAAAAAGVRAIDAAVTWDFVENGANGPEIQANIEVPERSMNVRISIRRNTDESLPASHLVEAVIETPADFPGKGIRSVPRLVLKENENDRGQPLIGASAQVADGFFWIALSAAGNDVEQNLQLLRQRDWIDLPIVYESGQRAILTFEKGQPGERAFEQAFAAWGTG